MCLRVPVCRSFAFARSFRGSSVGIPVEKVSQRANEAPPGRRRRRATDNDGMFRLCVWCLCVCGGDGGGWCIWDVFMANQAVQIN